MYLRILQWCRALARLSPQRAKVRQLQARLGLNERELLSTRYRLDLCRRHIERTRGQRDEELRELIEAARAARVETGRIRRTYDSLRREYSSRLRSLKAENVARNKRVMKDYQAVYARCQALEARLGGGRVAATCATRPTSSIIGTRTRKVDRGALQSRPIAVPMLRGSN